MDFASAFIAFDFPNNVFICWKWYL